MKCKTLRAQKLFCKKKNELKKYNDSKYLCHEPYGQLDDCSWVLNNKKCHRSRCDAQGQWNDLQFVLRSPSGKCTATPFVSKCDY